MGWGSAGYAIFNPVAKGLIDAGASDEIKTSVLSSLIVALRDGDWDTEDESLEQFKDDPAIVEAFRQHGVILYCGAESGDGKWCDLERGHAYDFHADERGDQWPAKNGDTDG